jgi:hypothetical protein
VEGKKGGISAFYTVIWNKNDPTDGNSFCTKRTVSLSTTSSKKPEVDTSNDFKVMSLRSRTDTVERPVIGTISTSCFSNAAILLFVATMLQKLVILSEITSAFDWYQNI